MKSRIGKALAAFLMLIFFIFGAIVGIIVSCGNILWWIFSGKDSEEDYIYRVGKAMDQVTNAALFAGHPKETISSHVGRWIVSGKQMPWWATAIDWITNLVDTDHCVDGIEEEYLNEPL